MQLLCAQGVAALPQHCMTLCAGFFAGAIVISGLRDVLPERYALFVPIPMAAAIPFYIGANLAVRDIFLSQCSVLKSSQSMQLVLENRGPLL